MKRIANLKRKMKRIVVDDALFQRTIGNGEDEIKKVISHGAKTNTRIGEDVAAPDLLYRRREHFDLSS
jgi:hypothetical protein